MGGRCKAPPSHRGKVKQPRALDLPIMGRSRLASTPEVAAMNARKNHSAMPDTATPDAAANDTPVRDTGAAGAVRDVGLDLEIGVMTCASCAGRVERAL